MNDFPCIDAHCHLEERTYGEELPQVIARARAAGVSPFIAVGATRGIEGAREVIPFAKSHADIYATAGIHPHDASVANDAVYAEIRQMLKEPKVVALGEIGLDYYYDHSPKQQQIEVFENFLAMGKEVNKPVMLHVRDAHEDTLACLDKVGIPDAGGVVHCFTAGLDVAEEYLRRGFYLSIPGVVTFKNSDDLRAAVAAMPMQRMLVETDCPYLAPIPMRGKRNEPSYIQYTIAKIAEVRGVTPEEIAKQTRENTLRLFGLTEHRRP